MGCVCIVSCSFHRPPAAAAAAATATHYCKNRKRLRLLTEYGAVSPLGENGIEKWTGGGVVYRPHWNTTELTRTVSRVSQYVVDARRLPVSNPTHEHMMRVSCKNHTALCAGAICRFPKSGDVRPAVVTVPPRSALPHSRHIRRPPAVAVREGDASEAAVLHVRRCPGARPRSRRLPRPRHMNT
jgi:hypothetical protein